MIISLAGQEDPEADGGHLQLYPPEGGVSLEDGSPLHQALRD